MLPHSASPHGSGPLLCRCAAFAALLAAAITVHAADAQAVLREATLQVTFLDSRTCEVEATFAVSAGSAAVLEHRLQMIDGTAVELLDRSRIDLAAPPHRLGSTQVLEVRRAGAEARAYGFRYRVMQSPDQPYRCPLWLPAAPTDGRTRSVHLRVALPASASATGSAFPALRWSNNEGTASLGHVPAFVLVPFGAAGVSGGAWDVTRWTDTVAVALLLLGMAGFVWRAGRR